MAKKVTEKFKMMIPAGAANPSPPVGPALGQRGVNSNEFCKEFNTKSSHRLGFKDGVDVRVVLEVDDDSSYTFQLSHPPVSHMLHACADVFSLQAVYEIASLCSELYTKRDGESMDREKQVHQICRSLLGTARSQGMVL